MSVSQPREGSTMPQPITRPDPLSARQAREHVLLLGSGDNLEVYFYSTQEEVVKEARNIRRINRRAQVRIFERYRRLPRSGSREIVNWEEGRRASRTN